MEKLIQNSSFSKVAETKPSYRAKVKPSQRPQVISSTDCYNVLKESWDTGKIEFVEQFKVMLLNRANRVLGLYETSTGGVAGTVANPELIFVAALKACASSIVLCHNHPSGNLKPSAADLQLTKKVKAGASCSTSRCWTTSSSPARVTTRWRTRGFYSPFSPSGRPLTEGFLAERTDWVVRFWVQHGDRVVFYHILLPGKQNSSG